MVDLANFKGCGSKIPTHGTAYWLKVRQIKAFGTTQAPIGKCDACAPLHKEIACGDDSIAGRAWLRVCDRCVKQLGLLW